MNITLSAVLLEAAELEPESAFWHQLLGGSVAPDADTSLSAGRRVPGDREPADPETSSTAMARRTFTADAHRSDR